MDIGDPNLDEEKPAIAYMLENIDNELSNLQDTLIHALPGVQARHYHFLASTIEQIIYQTIRQRLDLIGWGMAIGLTGTNTQQIIEDITQQGERALPHVYHERLRTIIHTNTKTPQASQQQTNKEKG